MALTFAFWLLLAFAPMAVQVSPHVCLAPCEVRIVVTIEPHPDNRKFTVELAGPMYQATEHQLDGDDEPRTQPPIWFKGLVAGDYDIVAKVYQSLGQSGSAATMVSVR